jgi:G:T/U-mismatch repair DNA glycosylase
MPVPTEEEGGAIERHPFQPFLPANALLLMLGTFPPAPKRWCMPWYYPNFQNDMWRIFGWIYFGDKNHFVDLEQKTYRVESLKAFLKERGVAIFDTALRIRRTKNTASDKDLEIVEPSNLDGLLEALPECRAVLTAGQLATQVFSEHYGITETPPMGGWADFTFRGRSLRLYRMPSSSRAYPLALEKKAAFYERMFREIGLK